jgi:hypothetical protein
MMQVSVVDRYKRRTICTESNHTIAWQVLSFARQQVGQLGRMVTVLLRSSMSRASSLHIDDFHIT